MKILKKKNYSYILFEENGKNYLNVLCGSSAMFDVTIELTKSEKNDLTQSQEALESFVEKINFSPESFRDRWEDKSFDFPKA